MNNKNTENYKKVREIFGTVKGMLPETRYQESKDTCVFHLGIDNLDFYYLYGNSQITMLINDEDIKVLNISDNTVAKIVDLIADFKAGKKIV